MHSLLTRRGLLSAIVVAVLNAGCTESKSVPARRLLTTITRTNKRLETATENFGRVVSRRLSGNATDADLRAGISSFKAAVGRILEESQTWRVPKTAEAEALAAMFRASLERRIEAIDEVGPRIVETMANNQVPASQKAAKARELSDDAIKRIESEVTAIRRAQREYAASAGVFAYE